MDNAYNYRLQTDLPEVDFDDSVGAALDALAEVVAAGHSGEEIQAAIYDTARDHDIEISELFEAGYRLFFDDTQGPRLGEFLGELEGEFVVGRLRRER
jgi:lysyl-tRNA synthetase class 1